MALEVIAHMPGCEGGNCPTIWRNPTTGAIRIRGANPDRPAEELDVDISAEDWAHLLAQLPR
jgi:hypothetical protein